MAIPDYETIMSPLLKLMGDGQEHSMREIVAQLTTHYKLTEDEQNVLLPSGQQFTFSSRVGWARTYLKKALLLESPKRGFIKITQRGLDLLAENPERIDSKFLLRYDEFKKFRLTRSPTSSKQVVDTTTSSTQKTPQELLQESYESLNINLADDLLETVKSCSPNFFERLVVELLVKMGYGGSLKDAGQAIGKSGDEGIDGLIKEDKLGLDTVFIQAKRWQGTVGRPELQKFAGALQGQRAKKGVFITTSDYSKEAREYTKNIDIKIALIDGQTLAQYMIDFDIGVSKESTYEVKRIDSDYFIED